MDIWEVVAFIAYFVVVLAIGVYFYFKGKKKVEGEKDYFLGGRNMGGFVAALSAGASDMSAWVLMGLPGAICMLGVGQVWIPVGLVIGTICAWIFVAPKLRRYAIKAGDSITIPQFLSNRFKAKSNTLRITCAVIFVIAYCIYSASSITACGELFNTVTGGMINKTWGMIIAAAIVIVYTLLGGFNAVCWTDFFQGLLMLAALMILPIIALFVMNGGDFVALGTVVTPENYYNVLASGTFNWESIAVILSGLGWGLGYFGMPHILIRYISIKNEKEMRRSQIVGSSWTTIICIMSAVVALVAHEYFGNIVTDSNQTLVFVMLARNLVPGLFAGILISAIIAASMSTADSQLLASSSAFASDIYKAQIKKDATDKQMLVVGRVVVCAVSVVALAIALMPGTGGIMGLVSNAWSIFGSSFGPAIILSLYFRKFNYKGAVAGIITGFAVSVLWLIFLSGVTGLYEIIPGFISSLLVSIIVSKCTKEPEEEVVKLFDEVKLLNSKNFDN